MLDIGRYNGIKGMSGQEHSTIHRSKVFSVLQLCFSFWIPNAFFPSSSSSSSSSSSPSPIVPPSHSSHSISQEEGNYSVQRKNSVVNVTTMQLHTHSNLPFPKSEKVCLNWLTCRLHSIPRALQKRNDPTAISKIDLDLLGAQRKSLCGANWRDKHYWQLKDWKQWIGEKN